MFSAASLHAQPWAGIISPARAIDWTTVGIPGGIPSGGWTQSGSTVAASACGSGSSDCTSTIQAALSTCGTNHFVLLGAGTFRLNGQLAIPGNCALRGQGANQTILDIHSTTGTGAIRMGSYSLRIANDVSITSGWSPGSTSIVVSSASGISVGTGLQLTELNDLAANVMPTGASGSQSNDGGVGYCGIRVMGQISRVTNVSGTTLTISPALMPNVAASISAGWSASTRFPWNAFIVPAGQPTHAYQQTVQLYSSPHFCVSGSTAPTFPTNGTSVNDGTCTWLDTGTNLTLQPKATAFTFTQYAGLENLQVYSNNTGAGSTTMMTQCLYCWVSGVENNYTDGDHMDIDYGLGDMVVNSYFSNAYLHEPGAYDSSLDVRTKTTSTLIQNNIFERLHASVMLEWGATGNVVAHNYFLGIFDKKASNSNLSDIDIHGAHPQYNLFEGNVLSVMGPDSTWGSKSNNTMFRQWLVGTTKACNPLTGRGTVTCSGANGWMEFQQSRAFSPTFEDRNWNTIGNVLGSAAQSALRPYGNPISLTHQVVAVCGPSPCGNGSRSYDNAAYTYTWGYGQGSDDGSSGFDSLESYSTALIHGDYSNISGSIAWADGVTHTLPASFYLSGKPSWWGSAPYPDIGTDVTGGTGPGGHTYPIPAQVCYMGVMGGTDGTGSPLVFNASTCYDSMSTGAPAPPTKVTVVVH